MRGVMTKMKFAIIVKAPLGESWTATVEDTAEKAEARRQFLEGHLYGAKVEVVPFEG